MFFVENFCSSIKTEHKIKKIQKSKSLLKIKIKLNQINATIFLKLKFQKFVSISFLTAGPERKHR